MLARADTAILLKPFRDAIKTAHLLCMFMLLTTRCREMCIQFYSYLFGLFCYARELAEKKQRLRFEIETEEKAAQHKATILCDLCANTAAWTADFDDVINAPNTWCNGQTLHTYLHATLASNAAASVALLATTRDVRARVRCLSNTTPVIYT